MGALGGALGGGALWGCRASGVALGGGALSLFQLLSINFHEFNFCSSRSMKIFQQ